MLSAFCTTRRESSSDLRSYDIASIFPPKKGAAASQMCHKRNRQIHKTLFKRRSWSRPAKRERGREKGKKKEKRRERILAHTHRVDLSLSPRFRLLQRKGILLTSQLFFLSFFLPPCASLAALLLRLASTTKKKKGADLVLELL